jgi:hypothetical protein
VYYTLNIHALLLFFGQLARRNTRRNGEEFIQICHHPLLLTLAAETDYEVIYVHYRQTVHYYWKTD